MDTNTIRQAARRQPFKPFTLRMNDGREFNIPHPEYVAVAPNAVVVINHKTEIPVSLEPLLIAAMQEDLSAPATPES